MKNNQLQKMFEELLAQAGVELNGRQPWDMRLHRPQAVGKIFA